jgi:hypothetical protein
VKERVGEGVVSGKEWEIGKCEGKKGNDGILGTV